MLLITFIIWLTVISGVSAGGHLIVLKASESLESFMKYDTTYPVAHRVKKFIGKSFQIGNFNAFSGNFSKLALDRLKRCPMVAEITPDITVQAFDVEEQKNSPKHLAQLSQSDVSNHKRNIYYYDGNASGLNVNAYIIDSGIETSHSEFEGRAYLGKDFTHEGSGDTNGHGTHVAGIVGSKTYGVAKDVNLIEVKALDKLGQGSLSTILTAIEYVVNHRKQSLNPGVANLSLGATKNNVLNRVIDAASETGLVIVVAAGNLNIDACKTLPASAKLAITVGSVDDSTIGIAEFSNWGLCVDIFASGVAVASVHARHMSQPQLLSGTSMSAPIVSGLIANLLSLGVSPFDVKKHMVDLALKGKISPTSLKGKYKTPNRMAYNGLDPEAPADDSDSDSEYSSDED